mgnify:FL=1
MPAEEEGGGGGLPPRRGRSSKMPARWVKEQEGNVQAGGNLRVRAEEEEEDLALDLRAKGHAVHYN